MTDQPSAPEQLAALLDPRTDHERMAVRRVRAQQTSVVQTILTLIQRRMQRTTGAAYDHGWREGIEYAREQHRAGIHPDRWGERS